MEKEKKFVLKRKLDMGSTYDIKERIDRLEKIVAEILEEM